MYLGVFLTLWSFGRDWEVLTGILFVCLVEFNCEATWSWTFISREFIIIIKDSVSLLVIHLFKLSSSWLNFCGLYVSKKLFISLSCQILGLNYSWYSLSLSLFFFFYFCGYQLWFIFLHFLFCLFGFSLFFALWVWLEICQLFFILSKNQLLGLLICFLLLL